MSERQKLKIKAKCQGVIRLLKIPKDVSYDAFYELLKNSFGVSNCQLQYSDEEGDSVELGSQDELQEAFKVGKNLSSLKINIITQENPTMSAMINKPSDCSNTTQRQLSVDKMNSDDSAASTNRSPNVLVEPLSSLTINEKPTPKPRPHRRRIGFYTSLCSDIVESEKGEDSQSSGKAKKKPKKEKSLRGSKYYASLADDIAAMKLGQPDESQKERKEMKRRNPSRTNEVPAHELAKKQNMDEGVKQVERDLSGVSLSDEEPPKWFDKVVDKMSQSVSSQVLGALNGAAGIATVNPVKAMRRERGKLIPNHLFNTCTSNLFEFSWNQ
ncbi:---NA--- [Paramuricea clavata]|uniref:---NA n=1 Tax=Paramuricea clavata TaxID=317549 RepID=A0A7D9EUA4_PARCT|nr:---NA--- [Paramuricea clavata]